MKTDVQESSIFLSKLNRFQLKVQSRITLTKMKIFPEKRTALSLEQPSRRTVFFACEPKQIVDSCSGTLSQHSQWCINVNIWLETIEFRNLTAWDLYCIRKWFDVRIPIQMHANSS